MSGSYSTEQPLRRLINSTAAQVLFLLSLGLLAVVLHVNFRIPLRLHGRHGIELMAILLLGRLAVDRSLAGSTVGLGAAGASLLPFWSFRDPLAPLLFLLPGIIVDIAFRYRPGWRHSWLFLTLLGGAAYIWKPLVRGAAAATFGLQYGFLKDGLLYGVFLHFIFGAIGGLIAFLYVLGSRRADPSDQA